ncbi:hypothetical protein IFM89_022484 [Coptis chinensis]|uniref:Uncharacterized protein n=1 Tax=Coptis chinensis TaxID=261450 RepID=A0A835IF19_9MAGN|nr:hypothetical protein IFM89_022484 [Coptis chinensis]
MLIHHFDFLITLLILLSFNLTCNTASPLNKITSSSAFFIFGDSSVDPGNNNYINTIPENRANYEPYGQNGFFQEPTGRFSDGRVVVDYIAEYANLPIIPPFLLPSAEFTHGANFASGGAGSNDYMGGYLGNPVMQQNYLPEEYVGMVIGNLTNAIQVLYEKGGRKFGFISLPPLGCLPALRALNTKDNEDGCFQDACALGLAHNNALSAVLTSLEHIFKGFKYCNSNFYNWLNNIIQNPSLFGFKDGVNACCGTGPFGGIFSCGGTKAVVEYQVCENADGHVWWDSFHPTEKIHKEFAKALWNSNSVQPYNLEDLFFDREKSTIGDIVDDQEAMQY